MGAYTAFLKEIGYLRAGRARLQIGTQQCRSGDAIAGPHWWCR
jgi:hypothetical protein